MVKYKISDIQMVKKKKKKRKKAIVVKLVLYLPLTGYNAFLSTNEIVLMKAVMVLKGCVKG